MPFAPAGEKKPLVILTEVFNEGYKVDRVKRRVALDVEWNAKDGNLDRDLGAYRALYDSGIIDCSVIVTRTQRRPSAVGRAPRGRHEVQHHDHDELVIKARAALDPG